MNDDSTNVENKDAPRVLFLNRSYWPDAEATGQLLAELCEDLADTFDVSVIAGQPNQNPDNQEFDASGRSKRNGVMVQRVRHTRFPKSSFFGRLTNMVTYLMAATLAAFRIPRPDMVVIETDPPLLCFLGRLLQLTRRCQLIVYLQDIYPDVAVALGKLPNGWLARLLRRIFFGIYRKADQVVVLNRDMRDLLVEAGIDGDRIAIVPNWVDTEQVFPIKENNRFRHRFDIENKFVVMYSGNMGLSQRLHDVLDAAEQLREQTEIKFLFVGHGAGRKNLEEAASHKKLANLQFVDYQPKSDLADSLSAADLHIILLDPRITRYLMPSKLYGVLASGTASVVMAPDDCELAEIVRDERVGFVVPPADSVGLARTIVTASNNRYELEQIGNRARSLATRWYDRRISIGRFGSILAETAGTSYEPPALATIPELPTTTTTEKLTSITAMQSSASQTSAPRTGAGT